LDFDLREIPVHFDKKSLVLGFGAGCLLFVIVIAAFFGYLAYDTRNYEPPFRERTLPSGKTIKVTSFHLLWGIEHDDRHSRDDTFGLEYSSGAPLADLAALDAEVLQVFELLRPVSEQWDFSVATIAAFPTTQRKGRYYLYSFRRAAQGTWNFERSSAKVFIND
jgi:hypothetical protein